MAIEKNIKINVQADEAIAELDKLESSLRDVEKESGKTSKSIDDVAGNGGAIAILDGLTGGLATRFKDAYEATKLFNVSLKGMRTALIATGIGALVVAVGLLVAYWDDIEESLTRSNEKLQTQLDTTKAIENTLDAQSKSIDKQLELNALQGKANESLEKQKIAILKRQQEQKDAEIRLLEIQLQRLKATSTEVGFWDTISGSIQYALFGAKGLAEKATEMSGQRLAEIKALETEILNAKSAAIDLEITLFRILNPETEKTRKKEVQTNIGDGLSSEDLITLNGKELLNQKILESDQNRIIEQEKYAKVATENELKWMALTNEGKLNMTSQLLGELSGLVDQNSVAGKGIAIAQTGINTAQGIMQAFATLPTIPAIIAAALVGATGVAQTIKIAKTKIPSASGRGFVGGGGSAGGGSAAPSFNLVAGTASNQIASSVNQGTTPSRAYVVGSDVTTQQSMDRSIVSGSTL